MSKEDNLDFVLGLEEVPVTIQDPKTKKVTYYILREMDGTQRDKHLTNIGSRVKTRKGKMEGLTSFDGLQGSLIQRSMWEVEVEDPKKFKEKCVYVKGSEMTINLNVIQAWPSRVLEGLHKKCKQLNGLEDEKEETSAEDVLDKLLEGGIITQKLYDIATKFLDEQADTKSEAEAKND